LKDWEVCGENSGSITLIFSFSRDFCNIALKEQSNIKIYHSAPNLSRLYYIIKINDHAYSVLLTFLPFLAKINYSNTKKNKKV
jgi:hypothetical protein